jgi:hypothetical protein
MKSTYLGQRSFPFFNAGRQQETMDLVQAHMGLFHIIARIIETSKDQFENRIKNDPMIDLYDDRTYYIHTLTRIIKVNINRAIDNGELNLFKARYKQCQYYVLSDLFSIYIKKLNEKGLPSYAESIASDCRLHNHEQLPCVFIGPRVDNSGFVGGTCLAITNGKEAVYWVLDINPGEQSVINSIDFAFEDKEVDEICKPKEEFVVRRKKAE